MLNLVSNYVRRFDQIKKSQGEQPNGSLFRFMFHLTKSFQHFDFEVAILPLFKNDYH